MSLNSLSSALLTQCTEIISPKIPELKLLTQDEVQTIMKDIISSRCTEAIEAVLEHLQKIIFNLPLLQEKIDIIPKLFAARSDKLKEYIVVPLLGDIKNYLNNETKKYFISKMLLTHGAQKIFRQQISDFLDSLPFEAQLDCAELATKEPKRSKKLKESFLKLIFEKAISQLIANDCLSTINQNKIDELRQDFRETKSLSLIKKELEYFKLTQQTHFIEPKQTINPIKETQLLEPSINKPFGYIYANEAPQSLIPCINNGLSFFRGAPQDINHRNINRLNLHHINHPAPISGNKRNNTQGFSSFEPKIEKKSTQDSTDRREPTIDEATGNLRAGYQLISAFK